MPASLDQIVAAARRRVAAARRTADLRELERRAQAHAPRGFRHNLKTASQAGVAIVAELKKASPSRGLIGPILTRRLWLRNWKAEEQRPCQS